MWTKRDLFRSRALTAVAAAGTKPGPVLAQMLTGAPAEPNLKYSTEMPPGVASPNRVDTRFGTLNFFDGFPDKASAEKMFDNLDFQRAVQAFLFAIPAVSQVANREAFQALGPPNTYLAIWEQLMDARTVALTGNSNTVYNWGWLDLSKGPMVLEVPPKVLGAINDMWQLWVVDLGITGPDKVRRGKVSVSAFRLQRLSARGLSRRALTHLQPVGPVAHLPRERRSQAGRRSRQEVHENLSAL